MTALRDWSYEEHTADVKIVGYGNTPKRAIESVILGIMNIIYDTEKVDKVIEKEYEIQGDDILEVIYKILQKSLEIFYVENFAVRDVRVKNLRRIKDREKKKVYWIAKFKLFGESYNKGKHGFKKEVKAVTMHDLTLERIKKSYWVVEAVVDV